MHELKTNREAARLKSTKAEAEKEGIDDDLVDGFPKIRWQIRFPIPYPA